MVIDMHVHPALFSDICGDKDRLKLRCDEMGYHLMGPSPLDVLDKQNAYAGIDKMVLLPLDHSVRSDAVEVLERAFTELRLTGLKLNPAKQRFYPDDRMMWPIYEKCLEHNKPVVFHAGLSWEPDTLCKYSHPLRFEEVALEFPQLRLCLAHMGWPWVQETAMLMIKYPNLYADTAMMYMDSAEQFFDKVFKHDMGEYWLDHNFQDQVMFGSNAPRFRPVRIKRGLDSLKMREDTRRKLYGENAMRFLGLEG